MYQRGCHRRRPTRSSMHSSRMPRISRCCGAPVSSTITGLPRYWRSSFLRPSEEQPELLAHHYTQAGLHEPAVEYWYKAGQRAAERSAHREAISHLHKGLEGLAALSETPDRTRQELRLTLALGPSLIALHGYAAPELADYHRHTRELCQRIGDPEQHSTVSGWTVVVAFSACGSPDRPGTGGGTPPPGAGGYAGHTAGECPPHVGESLRPPWGVPGRSCAS